MTKYMINKFMRAVEMSDQAVREYVADPSGYVQDWLTGAHAQNWQADDRQLTDDEEAAFCARDYGALYALGAHPYLLWHFTEAVYVPEVSWPELNTAYREAVRPMGYPDHVV